MSTQADLLDLIAEDPIHVRDRDAITEAIAASVDHNGRTSANHWRGLIPTWVHHKLVGATVHALIADGTLVPTGEWVMSDDAKGRNTGKPMRVYAYRGAA